jgi:AhpD family alkylhydroperoxidase
MMGTTDHEKITRIIAERKRAHKFYYEHSDVYRSFIELEEKAFAEGQLGKRYKELIAFGISICNNCESCMEWHLKQALDSGATREELIDAVGVAIEMGGGMATVPARFAMDVLEYYSHE